MFNVIPKKPMKPVFSSVANPHSHLAIDNGRVTGMVNINLSVSFKLPYAIKHLNNTVQNEELYIYPGPTLRYHTFIFKAIWRRRQTVNQ